MVYVRTSSLDVQEDAFTVFSVTVFPARSFAVITKAGASTLWSKLCSFTVKVAVISLK